MQLSKSTNANVGQVHLYLNYARKHWTHPNENPPIGLILCIQKDHAVARNVLDGSPTRCLPLNTAPPCQFKRNKAIRCRKHLMPKRHVHIDNFVIEL